MKALIVGGGTSPSVTLLKKQYQDADIVIAADSGANHLIAAGLLPQIVIGDMDSISVDTLKNLQEHQSVEMIRHQVMKDETDMDLCMRTAVLRGATEIVLLAATGSRWDHSLGNMMLMVHFIQAGIQVSMMNDHNLAYSTMKSISVGQYADRYLSLIAITPEVRNLRISGVAYPLNGHHLQLGSALCLSNQITSESAEISFDSGILMVFLSEDA